MSAGAETISAPDVARRFGQRALDTAPDGVTEYTVDHRVGDPALAHKYATVPDGHLFAQCERGYFMWDIEREAWLEVG